MILILVWHGVKGQGIKQRGEDAGGLLVSPYSQFR